ncbi:MAG TPA: efflux RND transporter periplasmic adaptor subunit, partial [Planctomycetota bacterium]|nr:efflux RND transporter periplasmic adaptor subunit [Planctomycetota bacterium]
MPTLLLLGGCEQQAPPAMERPPAPVVTAKTAGRDVPVYLDEIGKCVAREMVTIQPEVPGQITAIHFTDGADVHKGDPLFTIDPRPYQAQLDAAEANVVESRATAGLASTELERWQSVSDQRAVTQQDLDTKRSAVDSAAANVKKWQAAVDAAKLQLEYCSIKAPIDGRAGQRLVDLGNIVTANDTPLLVIQRLDPIYADFTVTENDLSAVQEHMAKGDLSVQ